MTRKLFDVIWPKDTCVLRATSGELLIITEGRDFDRYISIYDEGPNPLSRTIDPFLKQYSVGFSTTTNGGGKAFFTRNMLFYLIERQEQRFEQKCQQEFSWMQECLTGVDLTVRRRTDRSQFYLQAQTQPDKVTLTFIPESVELEGGDLSKAAAFEFTAESLDCEQLYELLRLLPVAMLADYGFKLEAGLKEIIYPPQISYNQCTQLHGGLKKNTDPNKLIPISQAPLLRSSIPGRQRRPRSAARVNATL